MELKTRHTCGLVSIYLLAKLTISRQLFLARLGLKVISISLATCYSQVICVVWPIPPPAEQGTEERGDWCISETLIELKFGLDSYFGWDCGFDQGML